MDDQAIPKPVTIITGFLGAGKTTFLNAWIAYHPKSRPIVIENEFGKEGIDAGLIAGLNVDILELNNGCLCCNLNEELLDMLRILWQRRGEFDELIIETTGIADPASVAKLFIAVPQMERYYSLERVVCLVDAQLIELELEETEEARRQIAFSDIIMVSKSDLVRKDHLSRLETLLSGINPFATTLFGNKDDGYPFKQITSLCRDDFDTQAIAQQHSSTGQRATHTKGNHYHNLSSISLVFKEPFDLEALEHRLMVFLNLQAREIYRVKGVIHAANHPMKIVVHSVSNLFAITEGNDWEKEEERVSRLVIIGRNLQSNRLENMLRGCLAEPLSPL